MILLRSNVPLKVDTTPGKRGKIRNSDPYHSSGTLTQKSIQQFRQQINDPISIQPKQCTYMETLDHWIKESQTHHLTRTSSLELVYWSRIFIMFNINSAILHKHAIYVVPFF